jgi:hypothetical protein
MTDTDRKAARRRAYHGRASRLAKEAAQQERQQGEARKPDEQRQAEVPKDVEKRVEASRKRSEAQRLERQGEQTKKEFNQKAEDQKAAAQQKEQDRKERAAKAAEQRAEAARKKTAQQLERQRADEARKEFNRQSRAEATKAAQQHRQQIRERAEAFVAERHQRDRLNQQMEHRRQTDRMRVQQREERNSFQQARDAAATKHADQMHTIDAAERRELQELGERRRSLAGRIVGIVRGAGYYDQQAQAIGERHEADRMRKHRDLEALKEKQFTNEQTTRLRQAQGLRNIREYQRHERRTLVEAQERNRPNEIKAHQRDFARAAHNERARFRQQHKEQQQGRSRGHDGPELSR